jgi:hypothetical protein
LFFFFFPLVSLFTASLSAQKQNPQWQGRIEDEGGVKVAINPDVPLYGEFPLELEEDLVIGNEEDENYMFYGLVNFTLDSQENFFVLNGGSYRVQKFDRDGNYLQSFGGRGQGPGEFEQPFLIYSDKEDRIFVLDTLRRNLLIYKNDGQFEKSIKSLLTAFDIGGITNGNIIMKALSYSPEGSTDDIIIADAKGEKIKTVASYPIVSVPNIKGHSLGNPYSHRLYFCPISDGRGIYGHSSEFQICVISNSGEIDLKIEVSKRPKEISQKDRKDQIQGYMDRREKMPIGEKLTKSEVKKAYVFPEYKPFFSGIWTDSEDRIYVREMKRNNPGDRSQRFDVFDKDGHYIYIIIMPFQPKILRDGFFFSLETDLESGYMKIKRYKIKNWDQIKEGIE